MPVLGLSQEDTRNLLSALDQALFHHDLWGEELNRTLICRLTPDQADLLEDAHHRCRFGQWLYGPSAKIIAAHPGLVEIAKDHKRMHTFARELLIASTKTEPMGLEGYERFITARKQLRLESQTIKHELEDALYNLDPLTGAANRIGMLTKLREQQALVRRKVHSCGLAMLDLDFFKAVNETYGHAEGDRVLVAVARQVLDHLRPYDTLFRYGGEEFLVCLPDANLKTAHEVVERLRSAVADFSFGSSSGKSFHVTVSCGVTLLDADVSVEQSIERADKALHAAKVAGRDRVVVWDVAMV